MWKMGEMTEKLDEEMEEQSSGEREAKVVAFVGRGVEFKGVITYDGTVRIDGRLEGEIHTEGVLVVGEDAVITAQVTAGTVISRGKITGDVVATGKVRLLAPAALNGSVKAPLLSIEEGVLFNGSLEMAKNAEQPEVSRVPAGAYVTPIRVSSTMKTVG
jgi:cytoskeletal protein CcmA (bactofilin family)